MKAKFEAGDKVFAKVRGYPPWPAMVQGLADDISYIKTYHIYFYGTGETGIVKEKDIWPFVENKARFGKPKKQKNFTKALLQIEAELSFEEDRENHGDSNGEDPFKNKSGGSEVKTFGNDTSPEDQDPKKRVSEINNSYSESSSNSAEVLSHPLLHETQMDHWRRDLSSDKNSNILDKKLRYERLKIQAALHECNMIIRSALHIKNVNTRKCISCLDRLKDLKITALMLKMCPDVVPTIRKLRRYVGIITEKMDEKQKKKFEADAAIIRDKAELISRKFQSLFFVPSHRKFWDVFEEERKRFDKDTRHMNDEDIIALSNDL